MGLTLRQFILATILIWSVFQGYLGVSQTINSHNQIGEILKNNNFAQQVYLFNQLRLNLENQKDTPDSTLSLVYHRLGTAYYQNFDGINAGIWLNKAKVLRKKTLQVNHLYIAHTVFNQGMNCKERLNDYSVAIEYFKEAAKIYKQYPEKINKVIECFIELSNIYRLLGDYEASKNLAEGAKKIKVKDFLSNIKINNTLGNIYNDLLLYQQSEKHYEQSLQILFDNKTETDNTYYLQELANIYNNLGVTMYHSKKYKKSILYYEKANEIWHNLNLNDRILMNHSNMAKSYIELGLFDQAIKNCNLISSINHEISTENKAYNSKTLFEAYYKKKEYTKAKVFFNNAYQLLRPHNEKLNLVKHKNDLLNLIVDDILFKPKLLNFSLHLQADSLIDLMRQEHTEQGSKLFWREKTHSFYENAIETCFKLKNFQKAFFFMEKSRSILLLDALKDIDASKVLNPEQQSTEQSLRYQTIGLQSKLNAIDEQDKSYAKVFQQLMEAKEKYAIFIKSLEKSNPNYYNLKYNNQYVSLPQIQAELKLNNQAFLEYFVGDSAVYALYISPTKIDLKKIDLKAYQKLSLKYLQLSALRPPHTVVNLNEIQNVSYQLYQLIFEPFYVSEKRLVISQDNLFIPFESLILNLKSKQFLLQKYAISYTYSANVLMRKHDKSGLIQNNLLGFAPQKFENFGLTSLIGSDKVIEKIENNYFSGKIFLNQVATKENFIQNASRYKIIQLFTHGKADSSNEETKIYFHDKALSISELYVMKKLKASLVVLSACETNLGKTATGEGIMSFARGFAYLDVPSTVSTLWSVNNEATYQLTDGFYKYLKTGVSKDVALQKAKIDYLNSTGNTYPYYWSAMVLIGDSSSIDDSFRWLVIGSIVLLLSIVLIVILYKKTTLLRQV